MILLGEFLPSQTQLAKQIIDSAFHPLSPAQGPQGPEDASDPCPPACLPGVDALWFLRCSPAPGPSREEGFWRTFGEALEDLESCGQSELLRELEVWAWAPRRVCPWEAARWWAVLPCRVCQCTHRCPPGEGAAHMHGWTCVRLACAAASMFGACVCMRVSTLRHAQCSVSSQHVSGCAHVNA